MITDLNNPEFGLTIYSNSLSLRSNNLSSIIWLASPGKSYPPTKAAELSVCVQLYRGLSHIHRCTLPHYLCSRISTCLRQSSSNFTRPLVLKPTFKVWSKADQ